MTRATCLASARSRFGSCIINAIHYQNAVSLPKGVGLGASFLSFASYLAFTDRRDAGPYELFLNFAFCILNFTLALCAFLSLPISDRQKGAVFCLLLTSERQYPTRIFGRVLYLQDTRG